MTKQTTILTLLLILSTTSSAQVCDPTQATGQCGFVDANGNLVNTPEEVYSSYQRPYNNTYVEPAPVYRPPPPPPPPEPIRESRYGALAIYPNLDGLWDSQKMFASVHGIHSKESARKKALQECKRKSGHSCQVFDYADQCLSVTTGLNSEGLKIYSAVSPQPGQAPLDAMQQCLAAQAKECEYVVQEECSLPVY
ncbi:DUF4189 domain-containing protein [Cardiobacterium hominis]|uniref:DUF4189 domain-containing protein n=1 Tax=Cardiobacterium hominis TaxID=2718 RepID=UPI0028EEC2CC|nr:DUF4189 domain-containing protein [Cardiobacterium hominis]